MTQAKVNYGSNLVFMLLYYYPQWWKKLQGMAGGYLDKTLHMMRCDFSP